MIIQGVNVANVMTFMLNGVSTTLEYGWGNDFNHKEIKEHYEKTKEEMQKIDYSTLSVGEMEFLGFRRYSEDKNDYLVPLWLLRYLPTGTKLKSIFGEVKEVGVDYIENDVRGGCLAYSIVRK